MFRQATLALLFLAACEPSDPCTYHEATAQCAAYSVCAQCSGSDCTSWFEAEDGTGRSWTCDGDHDGNGYEDCIDEIDAATCSF